MVSGRRVARVVTWTVRIHLSPSEREGRVYQREVAKRLRKVAKLPLGFRVVVHSKYLSTLNLP